MFVSCVPLSEQRCALPGAQSAQPNAQNAAFRESSTKQGESNLLMSHVTQGGVMHRLSPCSVPCLTRCVDCVRRGRIAERGQSMPHVTLR